VEHICNPNTQEAEAGRSRVLGCIVRPCLKRGKKKKKNHKDKVAGTRGQMDNGDLRKQSVIYLDLVPCMNCPSSGNAVTSWMEGACGQKLVEWSVECGRGRVLRAMASWSRYRVGGVALIAGKGLGGDLGLRDEHYVMRMWWTQVLGRYWGSLGLSFGTHHKSVKVH
jgi:hypothetical protein